MKVVLWKVSLYITNTREIEKRTLLIHCTNTYEIHVIHFRDGHCNDLTWRPHASDTMLVLKHIY